MNFPGVHLMHALVVLAGGDLDAASSAANALLLSVNAALVAAVTLRLGGGPSGALAGGALTTGMTLQHGPWQSLQRDALMLPFLLGATLLFVGGDPAAWRRRRLVAAGALLGAAFAMKPAAAFWGGLVCGSVLLHPRFRTPRELGRAAAALAAGGLAVWAPVLAWLAAIGSLRPFVTLFFDYLLPVYSKIDYAIINGMVEPSLAMFLRFEADRLDLHGGLRVWAVALSLAALARRDFAPRVAAAAVLGALAGYLLQSKGWPYHLFPAYAAVSALTAATWGRELCGKRPPLRLPSFLFFSSLLAALSFSAYQSVPYARSYEHVAKTARVLQLVDYFKQHAAPGDTIQVLDTTEGGLDMLLRLRQPNATPFVYDFFVAYNPMRSPFVARLRAQFMAALEAKPPTRVLVFRLGWPRNGYERFASFPQLTQFLSTRYVVEHETQELRVLRLAHD